MLVKFFDRGKGTGDAPVNYLLGDKFVSKGMQKNDLREGARIVSGNPLITQEMINSSNFSKRYTSGVLSFEEAPNEVSEADKQAIIADFEKMLFPGMNPDRTNFLWVEHIDKLHPDTGKPRLELNFVIPTTELYSGKRLQPYFHAQDKKYSNAWQTLINNSFGLSDPDDVIKRRLVNPFDSNQSPKKSAQQLKADIEDYIRVQMEAGLIKNRKDVISQLELMPDLAIQVTRQTPKSLSVVSDYNQKPIRLKGYVFDENFDFDVYQAQMQPVNPETLNSSTSHQSKLEKQASKQQRVDQALLDFNAIYLHKAKYNQKKYAISEEEMAWVMQNYAPRFFDKAVLSEQNILAENPPNVEGNLATEAIDESFDNTTIQPPTEIQLSFENSVNNIIDTSENNQKFAESLSNQIQVSKTGSDIAEEAIDNEMALAKIQQEKFALVEKTDCV